MGRILTPVIVKEAAYAKVAELSGTDATFGAAGTSGLYDGLSGVENHYYVIHGWQAYYHADSSTKGHFGAEITDFSGRPEGIIFCGTETNGIVQLAQPVALPVGSAVNYRVLINDITSGDEIYTNIFYSLIRTR